MKELFPFEAEKLIDKYFPKGDKRRGQALIILAVAFNEGLKAGEEKSK